MNVSDTVGMSFDQIMQILGVAGAWFSGIGAVAAVIVALWLARRSERINLKIHVGLRVSSGVGDQQEFLVFDVANRGERPVTIDSIVWRIGPRRNKKRALQLETQSSLDKCPKTIEYGKRASFRVYSVESPNWMDNFVEDFISDNSVKTLRAQIHTSVGHIESVKPEDNFLKRLEDIKNSKN